MNKPPKELIIIGYSLDSCMMARYRAEKYNQKVTYFQSGILGYPFDDIREYITYENVLEINALGVNVPFKRLTNSVYAFIPYNELKFVNNRNGLLSYPINKSSFDSAEEWEQVASCLQHIDEFRDDLEKASNYINIYKNFFPKWLYDSLLRYMGVNKWGGIRQSKLTREGLAREIDLSCMDGNKSMTIYRPEHGYQALCQSLLTHPNIHVTSVDISQVNKMILQRFKGVEFILADNRVDYICNYTHGNFDRVQFSGEHSRESNLEEFFDISEGVVFTPTKDYWCVSNEFGHVVKVRSSLVDSLNYKKQSEIPMTNNNKKLYEEYQKMLSLYSGKILYLSSQLTTIVK